MQAWKHRRCDKRKSCTREESGWVSSVYNETKNSSPGSEIKIAWWNNCTEDHLWKWDMGVVWKLKIEDISSKNELAEKSRW